METQLKVLKMIVLYTMWHYVQPHHHGQAGVTMLQALYTERSWKRC
jgi:hypothetical protein